MQCANLMGNYLAALATHRGARARVTSWSGSVAQSAGCRLAAAARRAPARSPRDPRRSLDRPATGPEHRLGPPGDPAGCSQILTTRRSKMESSPQYTRRDTLKLLGAVGASAAWPKASQVEPPAATVVERNDAAVRSMLTTQVTDPASPFRG